MNHRGLAILLVGVAVGLNLASAVVLKEAADMKQTSWLVICMLISLVILINAARVLFWAAIHKRFRLSDSYPLTSLFFPLILATSALFGEEIGYAKLIGTVFITLGVLVLMVGEVPQAKAGEQAENIP